jgi:hypothetical protein
VTFSIVLLIFPFLGQNIPLGIFFSNILNLCSLKLRDHVSHPYKRAGTVYLVIKSLDRTGEDETRLLTKEQQALPEFNVIFFFPWLHSPA